METKTETKRNPKEIIKDIKARIQELKELDSTDLIFFMAFGEEGDSEATAAMVGSLFSVCRLLGGAMAENKAIEVAMLATTNAYENIILKKDEDKPSEPYTYN